MQTLFFEATSNSPKVVLDKVNNHFEISGKSVDGDAEPMFSQILNWLDWYIEHPNSKTTLDLDFTSFNISSSKRILFILYKLDELRERGFDVNVNWHYKENDDDMYEVGRDYAYMVKIPFNFLVKQQEMSFEIA
jgi:hypothetical protein